MLSFVLSLFLVFFMSLTQFAAAAENIPYLTPLRLGRIAAPHASAGELAFLSAVGEGNVGKANEFLELNTPMNAAICSRAFILASEKNMGTIVRALIHKCAVGLNVVQDALLVAARKNSGDAAAEILKSGAYDAADLKTTFTTALTCNSVLVVKAFLQFPKFHYPETDRARALDLCRTKKFSEMEKLLKIPREQLQSAANDESCVLF
jgi:hypothetical protein